MGSTDPWLSDLRKCDLQNVGLSRLGLPSLPHYPLRNYRTFTLRMIAGAGLLLLIILTVMSQRQQLVTYHVNPATKTGDSRDSISRIVEAPPGVKRGLIVIGDSAVADSFFNRHPDTFFLHLPLAPLSRDCDVTSERRRAEVLGDYFRCEWRDEEEMWSAEELRNRSNPILEDCVKHNFCFREQSDARLCSNVTCPRRHDDVITCNECPPINTTMVTRWCRHASLRVIYVTNLCDVINLKSIFTSEDLDVKVLHVVRDPRDVIPPSDVIRASDDDHDVDVTSHCDTVTRHMESARQEWWLDGKYTIIRYEDLQQHVVELSKKLYEFAGISLPPDHNLRMTSLSESDVVRTNRKLLSRSDEKRKTRNFKRILFQPRSVRRKRSSFTSSANWRTLLNDDRVHQVATAIERSCSDMMSALRYRLIDDVRLYDINVIMWPLVDDVICPDKLHLICNVEIGF